MNKILLLFSCLLVACHSLAVKDDGGVMYKSAAFKSWLLFDAADNFYAPPSESLAIFLAPCAEPKDTLGKPGMDFPRDRHYYYLPGRKEAWWIERPEVHAKCHPDIKHTPRLPSKYPWEVDMAWDINTYIEGLDIQRLAKLCYRNKPGCIYFMPGYREMFTRPTPFLLGGYVGPNVYVPARFITRSELNLSALMDNIWLLYQLERGGWITRTGRLRWNWSDKAREQAAGEAHTLAHLSDKERAYFTALGCIGGGKGALPAIPCEVVRERREIQPIDQERCLMRRGEGCYKPVGKAAERAASEEGLHIFLKNITTPNQGKAVVSMEAFGTKEGIMNEYGCTIRRMLEAGGRPKRLCRKIYERF